MTFIIQAWKADQSITTVRITATVAVEKARMLGRSGWFVRIIDPAGCQFDQSDFDQLLPMASNSDALPSAGGAEGQKAGTRASVSEEFS